MEHDFSNFQVKLLKYGDFKGKHLGFAKQAKSKIVEPFVLYYFSVRAG